MLLFALLLGCGQDAAPGDCPPCPECPGSSSGAALSPFEASLLKDDLDDLRAGVRPYNDEGFGVCKGRKSCDEFLGAEVTDLPEGDYVIHSDLAVPKLGEGWKVEFSLDCEVTTASGKDSSSKTKTYDVSHRSTGDRGYRLSPIWTISSPNKAGDRACSYALTPLRPDGSKGTPMKGRFTVPGE